MKLWAVAFLVPMLADSDSRKAAAREDRRVEQPKGYHIVPARGGETPPEARQEVNDQDNTRRRSRNSISDQKPPSRQPELKRAEIKP